jgi:hypothetical protein
MSQERGVQGEGSGMVSDRTGAGSIPRINGNGNGAGALPADAPLEDDRYDFLDDREPDFKWQPVGGSTRTGEPTMSPRGRGGLGRPVLIGAGLAIAVALGAGGAYLLKGNRPAPEQAPATTPASTAPMPAAAPAPAPAQPSAPVSEPVKDVTPPAADASGGAVLERPATPPPPGGEDGPPAPEGMR